MQCDQANLTDSSVDPVIRWSAADADSAWEAAVDNWREKGGGAIGLPFARSVANFFHGPDNWNCQDIGNTPCSGVVTCDVPSHPAGWLILDSMSTLHQVSCTPSQ